MVTEVNFDTNNAVFKSNFGSCLVCLSQLKEFYVLRDVCYPEWRLTEAKGVNHQL